MSTTFDPFSLEVLPPSNWIVPPAKEIGEYVKNVTPPLMVYPYHM
jgi:hypothetical protein